MTDTRTRAVIVVFDPTTTDIEAALVRNGLQVFRGVEKVLPVRGVPTDIQAAVTIAKDDLAVEVRKLRAQVHELSSRLENVQAAATGPVPVAHEGRDGVVEWKQSS